MLLSEITKQAAADLRANKLRSILTLFGIIWGIMAIMILLGWGFGFRDMMVEGMSKLGEDLVFFTGGHTSTGIGGYKAGRPIDPELADIEAIQQLCPSVGGVNPQIGRWFQVKYGNESRSYNMRGVLPQAKQMNNWFIAQGRFFSDDDIQNRRRFAFIGNNIKEQLFGLDSSPVGESIRINGVTFKVIGVAVEKKLQTAQINSRHDDQVLVPLTTAQQLWGDGRHIDLIFVKPKQGKSSSLAAEEIRQVMAERHHYDPKDEEAIFLLEFAFFEKMFNVLSLGLNILLGLIGIVTLFIGGIGVMNIMFLSVQERTNEIGIRKSVGARKRDIRLQFLAESLFITLIGGLAGFILGSALLGAINLLPLPEYIPLPKNSVELSLVIVFVMVLTGVVSGYIPAKNAANLQPVEALRYERGESTAKGKAIKPLWVSKTITGELIGQAIIEIRSSKSRTFLTIFGIFWGIAAIIILIGFGTGFQAFFEREFGKLGEKMIVVNPGRIKSRFGILRTGNPVRFTSKDIEALTVYSNEVDEVLPEYNCDRPVFKYGSENRAVHTLGAVPGTLTMRSYKVGDGRFINTADIQEKRRVCFLGATIKERLFGSKNADALNKAVKINGIRYSVIGVAQPKGMQLSIYDSIDDEKAFIPLTTALMDFSGDKYLSRLLISPVDKMRYKQTEREIRQRLGTLHGFAPDDRDATWMNSELEGMQFLGPIVRALQIFLGGVGVITLLIGAVGVMNIMFFIVTQRLREIGIRRAVGAFRKHIFQQFLIEALLVTFLGGLIGFFIGWGLNSGLGLLVELLRGQNTQLTMLFAPQNSLIVSFITVFFMVAAGFFAGLLPAIRAMRSDIVECLRYE
ncbi:ABC transporter permease [candidate division KSB1 bacterium]|nr:ABC transporter permease [candidate division KSB1 bacterium]